MSTSRNHINIKNPCHLKWNSLEGTGCSKFCNSCSTEVIDFTNKSNSEIIDFVMTSRGKVCARIRTDQVDRIIRTNRTNKQLMKALMVFILGFASVDGTFGRTNELSELSTIKSRIEQHSLSTHFSSVQDSLVTYSGKVVDEKTGQGLPKINVVVKGTLIGTTTDSEGNFQFEISATELDKKVYLVISGIGYANKEFKVQPESTKNLLFETEEFYYQLGEIRIPWYKSIWWTLTSPFRNG